MKVTNLLKLLLCSCESWSWSSRKKRVNMKPENQFFSLIFIQLSFDMRNYLKTKLVNTFISNARYSLIYELKLKKEEKFWKEKKQKMILFQENKTTFIFFSRLDFVFQTLSYLALLTYPTSFYLLKSLPVAYQYSAVWVCWLRKFFFFFPSD